LKSKHQNTLLKKARAEQHSKHFITSRHFKNKQDKQPQKPLKSQEKMHFSAHAAAGLLGLAKYVFPLYPVAASQNSNSY
jgi:hypothetical protein